MYLYNLTLNRASGIQVRIAVTNSVTSYHRMKCFQAQKTVTKSVLMGEVPLRISILAPDLALPNRLCDLANDGSECDHDVGARDANLARSDLVSQCAIYGNFSGPKAQEIVVSRGKILELLRPDDAGKVQTVCTTEVFGCIRCLAPFRLTGASRFGTIFHFFKLAASLCSPPVTGAPSKGDRPNKVALQGLHPCGI